MAVTRQSDRTLNLDGGNFHTLLVKYSHVLTAIEASIQTNITIREKINC
ncbi:MAG: hypothetical protein AAF298_07650 [Cyanobacteria bacterium P01_A01_bin.40]